MDKVKRDFKNTGNLFCVWWDVDDKLKHKQMDLSLKISQGFQGKKY